MIFLAAVVLSPMCAQAQLHAVKLWSAIYDGPGHGVDLPASVVLDKHGNFYITGRSGGETSGQDMATVRYSPSGQETLMLRYNSPANLWDEADALAVDDSGNIFVAGMSSVTSSRTESVLLKYSPSGSISWQSHFSPDTVNSVTTGRMVLDSLGNIYLGGTFDGKMLFLKYDRFGILTDSATIGDDSSTYSLKDLLVASSDAVYLAGSRSYWAGSDVPEVECAVVKVSAQGHLIWKKYLNAESARIVRLDQQGNPVVITQDGTTARYSSDGRLLWFRNSTNSSPSILVLTGLAIDSRNHIVVGGYGCPEACFDYMLIKYDADGGVIWSRNYNSPDSLRDFSTAMAMDGHDNIYLTGNSGASYSDSKCVTVKYDSSGGLIWDVVYSTSPGALDLGGFLAVDDSGCVCVGGYSAVATGWDYLAIRYRQDSGAGVDAPSAILPSGYTLDQNFPNPFNPRTTICYSIPAATHVSLNVYNLAGSEVATLVHGVQQAGSHSIVFDASSLSSGIYFYRLQTASFVDTRRLVVIK